MEGSEARPIRARSLILDRGLTIREVAGRLAMDQTHLGAVLLGRYRPTRRTIMQVAAVLEMPPWEVFPEYVTDPAAGTGGDAA